MAAAVWFLGSLLCGTALRAEDLPLDGYLPSSENLPAPPGELPPYSMLNEDCGSEWTQRRPLPQPAENGPVIAPDEPSPGASYDPAAFGERLLASPFDPPLTLAAFVGYDAFRGTPDGGWENNGIHSGANLGTRLGRFSDWTGIGLQIGGSMGVYNWSGTDYRMSHQNESQAQGFLTYGFFRRANEWSPWCFAVVQDWMFNSNFSVFAENPTLGQWRGQVGYVLSEANEFGIWGAWRGQGDTRTVNFFGPVTWRPINQFNPYWHHKWSEEGADTWLWIGVPEQTRLRGTGSLGDYVVGASAVCPLSDRVSLYTLVSYLHPSATPGPEAAREDAWDFTVGMSFHFGRNARSSTVTGQAWTPLIPIANNGTFLVDASHNY